MVLGFGRVICVPVTVAEHYCVERRPLRVHSMAGGGGWPPVQSCSERRAVTVLCLSLGGRDPPSCWLPLGVEVPSRRAPSPTPAGKTKLLPHCQGQVCEERPHRLLPQQFLTWTLSVQPLCRACRAIPTRPGSALFWMLMRLSIFAYWPFECPVKYLWVSSLFLLGDLSFAYRPHVKEFC